MPSWSDRIKLGGKRVFVGLILGGKSIGSLMVRWNERVSKFEKFVLVLINVVLMILVIIQYFQQKRSEDRVWVAQQISIIYDNECWADATGERKCTPKAHSRSREDAVKAYVSMVGSKARLKKATLDGMGFEGIDFTRVDFENASLVGTIFTEGNLEGAALDNADLRGSSLQGVNLSAANLTSAKLQGAILTKVKDYRASLREAILEKATLGVCAKAETDAATGDRFVGPLPEAADVRGADFTGAILKGASVCGVDFSRVIGLRQRQINSTVGDGRTILPRHLKRPKNWRKWGGNTASPNLLNQEGASRQAKPGAGGKENASQEGVR